jgi:tryptophan synthase beta chain
MLADTGDLEFDVRKGFVECKGFFGEYGGSQPDSTTAKILDDLTKEYLVTKDNEQFLSELQTLYEGWLGRPTPIYHAKGLSRELGGGQIYLKREDLAHTGVHKINHCLGEALLAKHMGRRRIVSETAGSHGLCLASAAACVGLKCEIYVGENDWAAQKSNITKMRMMGAQVIKVTSGAKGLKEAADKVWEIFLDDSENTFYAFSTIAGPQPFPTFVKDLQAIVGEEAKEQMVKTTGRLPDHVYSSVGGGSNALGIFQCFLTDEEVKLYAVDPEVSQSENTVNLGNPGTGYLENFALLHEVKYVSASAKEAANAVLDLSRYDGIQPNWESAYALSQAIKLAPTCRPDEVILVHLSGRADAGDLEKAMMYSGRSFDDNAEVTD